MKPLLSIVIPAYNEAQNFHAGLLKPAIAYLKKQKYPLEVIFVDDGSTDQTNTLLQKLVRSKNTLKKKYRLIKIPHGGKVAAVTAGILSARGKIILFTDFDQSTPLFQVDKFIASHQSGSDIVIGNRGGITKMDNTLFRRLRSWVFVTLVRIVLLPEIYDSQCGFKSFTCDSAKQIFPRLLATRTDKVTGGYMGAFDVEVLFIASKLGLKISQIPVNWKKIEGTRLNPLSEPIKMALDIVKIRIYNFLGKYPA